MENVVFFMGWFEGPFNGSHEATGQRSWGRCIKPGYCLGVNELPGFRGTFVTPFNENEILTTTDTLIIDEVVRPEEARACSFQ